MGAKALIPFVFRVRSFGPSNVAQPPINQTTATTQIPEQSNTTNSTPGAAQIKSTYSIAVRLISRDALDTLIDLKREHKELKCADVFSNPSLTGLVYINEILPVHKYQLFKRARSIAKTKGYAFTYIQSGNIYVRRNTTTDRILILSDNDLHSL